MPTLDAPDLIAEYEQLLSRLADGDGPGRASLLGWDLAYPSPTALLSFVDQILFRRMNDFVSDTDAPRILDCGANIGYTALHYKRLFPKARITAFEPDPAFVTLLRRNLARNAASDVEVVEAAAWTRDGRAPWIGEPTDGSRLADQASPGTVEVATVDLRRYLDADVDLLKVDIEGAEFDVIPHVASGLQRVKNILVECHVSGQADYRGLAQIIESLTGAGFRISLNTYGPWRDLVRRHVPAPLHAEQYLIVSGWRDELPRVSGEVTYAPYVGLATVVAAHQRERAQRDVVREKEALLAELADRQHARESVAMAGPFHRDAGHCWIWQGPELHGDGDTVHDARSTTVLVEDGRPLGPAHAMHAAIRDEGGGRFSHWGDTLLFSTSDNSDPNTNGRRYTVICRTSGSRPADVASR